MLRAVCLGTVSPCCECNGKVLKTQHMLHYIPSCCTMHTTQLVSSTIIQTTFRFLAHAFMFATTIFFTTLRSCILVRRSYLLISTLRCLCFAVTVFIVASCECTVISNKAKKQ